MSKNGEIPVDEHARAERLALNLKWLIAKMDVVHDYLCPDQTGTWQQRIDQVVEAARKLKERG